MCTRPDRHSISTSAHALWDAALSLTFACGALMVALVSAPLRLLERRRPKSRRAATVALQVDDVSTITDQAALFFRNFVLSREHDPQSMAGLDNDVKALGARCARFLRDLAEVDEDALRRSSAIGITPTFPACSAWSRPCHGPNSSSCPERTTSAP